MLAAMDDPQVGMEIGGFFGGAAREIRERMRESREARDRGERTTREECFTSELLHWFRGSIRRQVEELSSELRRLGTRVDVEFWPTDLPVSEEVEYGADLGIRLRIRTPELILVKGVLVQCKKMDGEAGRPTFSELRGRGEEQAGRMLRVTPASLFFLFNFGDQQDLIDMTSVPIGTVCPVPDGAIPASKRRAIGTNCPYWAHSDGGIWDLGVAVLPAARVLALSAGSVRSRTPLPIDARQILRGCLPLGVFMVDLFSSCFVGDMREEVVRLVTPPGERNLWIPERGLAPEHLAGFAVRQYLTIDVNGERPR